MNILIRLLFIICFIGCLNWGLIGFFGFDLVAALFGPMSVVSRLIYALVGVSVIVILFWSGVDYKNRLMNR